MTESEKAQLVKDIGELIHEKELNHVLAMWLLGGMIELKRSMMTDPKQTCR